MNSLRCPAVPILVAFASLGWAVDPIRMDVRSTFSGPSDDTSVVTVTLENDGPDARGVLQVSGQSGPTSYPVELPRGARKKLLTFPGVQWGEIDFTLQTDRGGIARKLSASAPQLQSGGAIALVSDESGGLAFLRKQSDGKRNLTARDAYVLPEDAPGRPIAYRAFGAVVLGPGAERMNDETVAALKDYAIGGGSVVLLGGASAPLLEDPRWVPVLPGREWKPKTLNSSPTLAALGGEPVPGPFTILIPSERATGATDRRDGSIPLESERGYGLGRIVVLGYSPLEQPLSAWAGRARAMARFMRGGDFGRSQQFLSGYLHSGQSENEGMAMYATSTSGPVGSTITYSSSGPRGIYSAQPDLGDPFSTKLPGTGTVFGILALYFVLVVPVSFLVLRKMKRGELAWVTAPVLALGFAALLFKSAQGLYAAALSSATQGVLVLQQGASDAMFFGTSQLFFPRGGTYDLKLENVDSLNGVGRNDYNGFGNSDEGLEGFNLVDVGQMEAPQLEANNLAFRELSYTQRVEAGDWFRIARIEGRRTRVQNLSPYDFNGSLVYRGFRSAPFSLKAGASLVFTDGKGDAVPSGVQLSPSDPRNFTRQGGRVALSGTLTGFRPGPQVGKEVEDRSGVAVIAFAQERL